MVVFNLQSLNTMKITIDNVYHLDTS